MTREVDDNDASIHNLMPKLSHENFQLTEAHVLHRLHKVESEQAQLLLGLLGIVPGAFQERVCLFVSISVISNNEGHPLSGQWFRHCLCDLKLCKKTMPAATAWKVHNYNAIMGDGLHNPN